jgi:type I restriction enzyme S subunit
MNSGFPMVALGDLLEPISRPEAVVFEKRYSILGAHWYAKGLYIKDVKLGTEIQADKVYRVEEGDFVYNRLFAWKGSFAIVSKEDQGCYVSNEFPCFKVKQDRIDGQYLWKYFSKSSAWDEALGLSSGGTPTSRNRLKEEKLLEMKIPLPSLEEQRRVVARIEELAAKIEEARGLRRESVEEVQVMFSSALVSLFEGNNAKCWPYEKLAGNGLAIVVAGQHIMAEEYNLSGDGFPYLTGPADFGARVAEIKRWTLNPKSIALPGDILLTVKGAGVGKINFAPDVEVAIGRQLMAIRPNPSKLLHEFVYFFLKHKFKHFQSIATATTVPGFKKTDVEELCIPIPDLTEQHHIVAYLDSLQVKVDSLNKLQSETSAELDALLPSILDKAFNGEL